MLVIDVVILFFSGGMIGGVLFLEIIDLDIFEEKSGRRKIYRGDILGVCG